VFIPITQKIVDLEGAANRRGRAHLHAEREEKLPHGLDRALRKTELRDAILEKATDGRLLLEHRDIASCKREPDSSCNAGRAGADDCAVLSGIRCLHVSDEGQIALEVGLRDVVLDRREVDRDVLPSPDAVPLALRAVIADDGADDAQRIVEEKHRACFLELAVLEERDCLRDGSVYRTAFAAERTPALQAAVCFIDDTECHGYLFPLTSNMLVLA
jgi:hypothetical protein